LARLSLIIPKHVIAICEGAWYDPEVLGENSLCKQGCVNVLNRDKCTSSTAQASADRVLADLEKYKGEIKLVATFSKFSPRFGANQIYP